MPIHLIPGDPFIYPEQVYGTSCLARLIQQNSGYRVHVLQMAPGMLKVRHECRIDLDGNVIISMESNLPLVIIAERNMAVSSVCCALGGSHRVNGTQQELADNVIAGFNTELKTELWQCSAGTTLGVVLFPRTAFTAAAEADLILGEMLRTSNAAVAGPLHDEFAACVHRRFSSMPARHKSLPDLALACIKESEPIPLPEMTPAVAQVADHLMCPLDKISAGEAVTVENCAELLALHPDTLSDAIQQLIGLTPKDFLRIARTQLLIDLLRSRQACVLRGIDATSLEAMADFAQLSLATAKRYLKEHTGLTLNQLRSYYEGRRVYAGF